MDVKNDSDHYSLMAVSHGGYKCHWEHFVAMPQHIDLLQGNLGIYYSEDENSLRSLGNHYKLTHRYSS